MGFSLFFPLQLYILSDILWYLLCPLHSLYPQPSSRTTSAFSFLNFSSSQTSKQSFYSSYASTMSTPSYRNTTNTLAHVGAWAAHTETSKSSATTSSAALEPHPDAGSVSTQNSATILADYYPSLPAPAVHAAGIVMQQDASCRRIRADASSVQGQPSWSTNSW